MNMSKLTKQDLGYCYKITFSKVLKKYDKVVGSKLKPMYLSKVEKSYPFLQASKTDLNERIDESVLMYARIATDGKLIVANSDLRNNLRERVVWERNTIWMDMVGAERRQQSIAFLPMNDQLNTGRNSVSINLFGWTIIQLPGVIPANVLVIFLSIVILIILINSNVFSTPEENNCFAILIFCTILWSFEVIINIF
jgi:phosphate transporter